MKACWFIAASALLLVLGAPAFARATDPAETLVAKQVVHLLDYVGSDYGGAVSGGEVTSEKELAEQIEVLAEAGRLAAKLTAPAKGENPRAAVLRVKELVERHAPEAEVTAAAKSARTSIAAFFDVIDAPRDSPSRERGQKIFEQHCATCHGVEGRADTDRAAQLSPRPANFQAPEIARQLSPARISSTVRFGVPMTAMVPFDFLSDAERWDVAFYVGGFDHAKPHAEVGPRVRIFGLGELANETDDELREDLRRAGIAETNVEDALADLRIAAPYDPETAHPKGATQMVFRARASLKKLDMLLVRGDREGARSLLLRVYLDDIEPIEGPLRVDPALSRDIERQFKEIRSDIDRRAPETEITARIDVLLVLLARAGRTLEGASATSSFSKTMLTSAGLAAREGVEAALLIAALLAIVGRAGVPERKKWVHLGWTSAALAGAVTWFGARKIVEMSGLGRELLEGIAALLAAAVLFYVSYWLFARREAARWMNYLRTKVGSGEAAFSLFGISFLAVYREAFETILFYQPLIAEPGSGLPAGLGALLGTALLVALVVAYGRAGRFAPPRSFFAFSTVLLYALAVVFSGQGISALQTTGYLPLHPVRLPNLPALGIYPTVETYVVQATLVLLALGAAILLRVQRTPPGPPVTPGGGMAGSREGAKL